MKRFLILFHLVFLLTFNGFTQITLTLQPDSSTGNYDFINSYSPTVAQPTCPEFNAAAWTIGGTPMAERGLVNFDLTSIPPGAIILSAYLTLYNNPNSNNGPQNGQHSQLSGSNASWLQRVTSSWNKNTTSWSNQPSTTTLNEATLPASTNPNEDYLIDVKALVQDMIDNPATSFGFMLMLQNEQYYRCLVFASCNHPDSTLHPKLVITYITGCTSLVLQPDSSTGNFDFINSYSPTVAQPTCPEFNAAAWTIGGTPMAERGLVNFDLTSIPPGATIQSAYLTLYNNPNSNNGPQNGQHSQLSGSNASWLQRVISSWNKNTTTWNNQPSTTTLNEANLPASSNPNEDYMIDVKALVQDMINNPSSSFGFMLMLQDEQYYRCLVFASCNHPNSSLHPKLEICYTTVASIPPVASFQSNDSVICANDCVNFTDLSTNATAWHWSFNGASPSSSALQNPANICYSASGNYDVSLIASNYSGSDTMTISKFIQVIPAPPTPTLTTSNDTIFCSFDTSYTSYQWYYNGSVIPGATKSFLVVSFGGNYNLMISNSSGCRTAVGIIIIGIQNYSLNNIISISPNPATNQLTIHTSVMEATIVSIINMLGQETASPIRLIRQGEDAVIDISNLPAGMYFLQMKTESESITRKFVKE